MTYFQPGANEKVRPGRIWYVLTLAVLVAGIAWLVVGLVSVASAIDGLQRVPVPGRGAVSLTSAGGYTIYYEGPGARNGRISPFHVNIVPASPGASVASLTQYGSSVTYNFGSRNGRAVLSLQISHPGRFAVTTTGTEPPNADIAIGAGIGSSIVKALLPAIPLIILGFGASLLLFIFRAVRKRRARQRAWV